LKVKGENGLIKRIIENWLTNTNELGYQIPFCQYLISENHTIIYNSSHGPLEQGKDIISIDENGIVHAYQLKGGDINLNEFRKIQGEIDDLITIPVKHPSVDASTKHKAYLVTNGTINDIVRTNIVDRNKGYKSREYPELETISKTELLQRFIKVHGSFLPTEFSEEFNLFLQLIISQGEEFLNKDLLVTFIESILFEESKNKLDIKRKISSSILLTQYILQPFEKKENHIAIIEGWTILASYIFNIIEKSQLEEKSWVQSYEIILQNIKNQLEKLKKEFVSDKNYLVGIPFGDGGKIYKSRLTIVLGWLSAYELFRKETENNYKADEFIYENIKRLYPEQIWYWGESATPFFIMMSLLALECNDRRLSNKIITDIILEIIFENDYQGEGLPSPYKTSIEIIASSYGISDAKIDLKEFRGSSYHLETLVDILVRRKRRDLLGVLWKKITYICKYTFLPDSKSDLFLWRCKSGKTVIEEYKIPQSWKELTIEATKLNLLTPGILNNKLQFMYYFLLCYPHRLNRDTIKFIDPNCER
jgi:hypothetical protein